MELSLYTRWELLINRERTIMLLDDDTIELCGEFNVEEIKTILEKMLLED